MNVRQHDALMCRLASIEARLAALEAKKDVPAVLRAPVVEQEVMKRGPGRPPKSSYLERFRNAKHE